MISEFNRFFKSRSLASTYKPTLAKCLLDIGDHKEDEGGQWVEKNGDTYTIDLHFIVARFLRYYHPLKFKFKLKQEATKQRIAIYDILEKYKEELRVKSTPKKAEMCLDKFKEMREKTIKHPAIRVQVLPKLLNDCNIYSISKDKRKITMKKEIVEFMQKNKNILESALNHMIASYLEKCNSSPNISTKLEEKIIRTKLQTKQKKEIVNIADSCCFYCGQKDSSFAEDHFLPWNYLFQTEQYNMVPACTACNSSKLDRLPNRKYLDSIIDRNKKLKYLPIGYSNEFMKNMYENCRIEYHGIGQKLWEL